MVQSSFESEYAAAADRVLQHDRPRGVRRDQDAEERGPGALHAGQRRRLPARRRSAQALRQIAQLIKADVGLEVAFAESGNWDHHVNEGAATGQLATRLDDFGRGIAALARDLGDRMAGRRHPDDVGVRPRGRRRTATAAPITATATR